MVWIFGHPSLASAVAGGDPRSFFSASPSLSHKPEVPRKTHLAGSPSDLLKAPSTAENPPLHTLSQRLVVQKHARGDLVPAETSRLGSPAGQSQMESSWAPQSSRSECGSMARSPSSPPTPCPSLPTLGSVLTARTSYEPWPTLPSSSNSCRQTGGMPTSKAVCAPGGGPGEEAPTGLGVGWVVGGRFWGLDA